MPRSAAVELAALVSAAEADVAPGLAATAGRSAEDGSDVDRPDSSIPTPPQHVLMTLERISRAENLTAASPADTGKSHLAEALADKAIDYGMKDGCRFITTALHIAGCTVGS